MPCDTRYSRASRISGRQEPMENFHRFPAITAHRVPASAPPASPIPPRSPGSFQLPRAARTSSARPSVTLLAQRHVDDEDTRESFCRGRCCGRRYDTHGCHRVAVPAPAPDARSQAFSAGSRRSWTSGMRSARSVRPGCTGCCTAPLRFTARNGGPCGNRTPTG